MRFQFNCIVWQCKKLEAVGNRRGLNFGYYIKHDYHILHDYVKETFNFIELWQYNNFVNFKHCSLVFLPKIRNKIDKIRTNIEYQQIDINQADENLLSNYLFIWSFAVPEMRLARIFFFRVTGPNGIMVAPKWRVTSLVSIHYEEVILK